MLAALWAAAALPDVIQTFFGNRPTNDISFAPGWLKGLRDICTLAAFLLAAWQVRSGLLLLRVLAVVAAVGFVGVGLNHGAGPDIAIRGVLCIPVVAWTLTSSKHGAAALYSIASGLFKVLTPMAIITSILLGLFGAGMYFESIGPYERNPGLFLSPSATAFWAAAHILFAAGAHKKERWTAFALGILSMSGIFYINTALLFGKFPRWVYLGTIGSVIVATTLIGIEQLIDLAATVNVGVRSSDAVSITLITRLAIILESINGFTLLGNYPRGLNVATNQGLDAFFPDNAFLAAGYAYGVTGLLAIFVLIIFAYKRFNFGIFLLMFTTSFFYVWFENLLFAGVAGAMMNAYFSDYYRSVTKTKQ
jgi:hypothetical protein